MGADAKIDLEKVDHFYLSFVTPVCLYFFSCDNVEHHRDQ